jgi:hypothetical protein
MRRRDDSGIRDITNSESKLVRLLVIASIVDQGYTLVQRLKLQVASELGLKSNAVIGRHVRLAEKLGVLIREGDAIRLSGPGRILVEYDDQQGKGHLTDFAIVYFAQELFRVAEAQITRLLDLISEKQNVELDQLAIEYFQRDAFPWNPQTVRRSLEKYRITREVPRLFVHKVSCMVGWLRDLGLVSEERTCRLTAEGRRVCSLLRSSKSAKEAGLVYLSGLVVGLTSIRRLDTMESPSAESLIGSVAGIASSIKSEYEIVDYGAARFLVTSKVLLEKHLAVEEAMFYELVRKEWERGMIRGILAGRDGRPSGIVIPLEE